MVLVDTSVWIEFLERPNPALREEFSHLLWRGQVATAGIVLAELRRGCRSPAQVQVILNRLEPLVYWDVDWAVWLRAGELAAEGAARGVRLEIGDCLLAALALRENCSIFTLDRDFERIPGLKLHGPRVN